MPPHTPLRLRPALLALLVALPVATAATRPAGPRAGFVSEGFVRAQALEYLRFATQSQNGSILNAIAHMERESSDPGYLAPVGAVNEDDWAGSWQRLDKLLDTRDFDGLYLLNALLGYEGHPHVTPAAWERVRRSLLEFKYWFTDPTPILPDPGDPTRDWDESFYWTENHQILFHTLEYLAGQRFPDECFVIRGFVDGNDPGAACGDEPWEMTGAQHVERARERILAWLDERWAIGFVEWHSNIYYQKDATPLLTLIEYAGDAEIRERAAMLLDVLLMDIATHSFRGQLGSTHGRSEMKDTHRAPANDTWGIVLQLFGQQDHLGYESTGDPGAVLFARAKRYRMPQVIQEAARSPATFADRTQMSIAIDESAPFALDPEPPPGTSFEDTPENFTFWWGLGAWTVWQVIPLTVRGAEYYNLWDIALLRPFADLANLLGPDDGFSRVENIPTGMAIAQSLWPQASLGLLKQVNSYTWRTPRFMLSTAQDYRKGANAGQVQAWQATLGPETMVFTNHPGRSFVPVSGWMGVSDGQPGYWSGSASLPRSAQHENVAVHLYSPRYASSPLFAYPLFTHAYFPQQHFDEVVQGDGWTFGRLGDAYVGLWSWRPAEWRPYTPAELTPLPATTAPFDLRAPGGPDNVWIVECGSADAWPGGFPAFAAALRAARVEVTPRPSGIRNAGVEVRRFDVVYESPSQGEVAFGWDAPLRVDGAEIAIGDYPRVENPWVTAERGAPELVFQGQRGGVRLDWPSGARIVYGGQRPPRQRLVPSFE